MNITVIGSKSLSVGVVSETIELSVLGAKRLALTANSAKPLYATGYVDVAMFDAPAIPLNTLYFLDNTPIQFLDGGYAVWVA